MGKDSLLAEVDAILAMPVGDTTMKEFIAIKRNRLATHRTFSFSLLPQEIQDVTFSDESLYDFYNCMLRLDKAVDNLYSELLQLESNGTASQ